MRLLPNPESCYFSVNEKGETDFTFPVTAFWIGETYRITSDEDVVTLNRYVERFQNLLWISLFPAWLIGMLVATGGEPLADARSFVWLICMLLAVWLSTYSFKRLFLREILAKYEGSVAKPGIFKHLQGEARSSSWPKLMCTCLFFGALLVLGIFLTASSGVYIGNGILVVAIFGYMLVLSLLQVHWKRQGIR